MKPMPARRSCSFCGNEIEPGTGKMFIRKDGTVFLFCSHKCQSNLLHLGRVPRWTPWTQAFRRAAGRAATEEAIVSEEVPAPTEAAPGEATIETPKGKDIPADLADLIDKRLGPDLPRGGSRNSSRPSSRAQPSGRRSSAGPRRSTARSR